MRRLFLNRLEPAKKSGQNIPKNRCRTTIAERMMETLAELPFIGDQVVCLSHEPGRPQRNAIPSSAPALGSPEWQHQVAEGQKALLRAQGFGSSGPLKAIAFSACSTATSGG